MKESQSHQAFAKWLDRNQIPFVHSRTDKRHTNAVGDCDFYCFLAGRVLGIEVKIGKNKLSKAQEERIAYLRRSGMVVHIARSVPECVGAVESWLGVENAAGEATEREKQPSMPDPQPITTPAVAMPLFIGNILGTDYVFEGDSGAGGTAKVVRLATAADLMNLRRQ